MRPRDKLNAVPILNDPAGPSDKGGAALSDAPIEREDRTLVTTPLAAKLSEPAGLRRGVRRPRGGTLLRAAARAAARAE